jgi:chemotaxis signal transduction protein
MSQVLIGRCGEFLVAFPAPVVQEVLAGPVLGAPDPRCAGWRGSLPWRGRRIPLVDLRARLRAPDDAPPGRAVVTAVGAATVALAVDDVLGLQATDLAAARAPLPGLPPVTATGNEFLMVVDTARLFSPPEAAALAQPEDHP